MRSLLLLIPIAVSLNACVVETRPAPPPPSTTSQAASPGQGQQHPAYLHALSDLRYARAELIAKGGDGNQKWDERNAVAEIDAAIAEIKRAAIDDGKNLDDHPAVDAREPRSGKLHHALATLRQSRADIEHEEDHASVRGLRDRALQHIDAAIRLTNDGINAS
jgi:hypothetical protein